MDIQYLLFLQDFRNSIDNALTPFMEGVSMFAVTYLILFAAFIVLTMFSRNYLGVHTPQDVCVGLGVSVLSLFFTAKLFRYLDAHPEKENRLLFAGFVFCCLALVYITLKPYPMDYTAGGKLLVDPQKMMNDGYGDTGKMMGFNYIALFPVVLKIFDKRE